MSGIQFQGWPKISRLFRDVVISEKIDGTNAAVGFVALSDIDHIGYPNERPVMLFDTDAALALGQIEANDTVYFPYAQSRSKVITPKYDNHGFASWVQDHQHDLFQLLGPGLHFGEWWGSGINRGYGLQKGEKRFSLFNTSKHIGLNDDPDAQAIGVATVPVMYEGPFDTMHVRLQLEHLAIQGSFAAPGYMNPEGVVTFHTAANQCFKTTIEKDEKPKGSDE